MIYLATSVFNKNNIFYRVTLLSSFFFLKKSLGFSFSPLDKERTLVESKKQNTLWAIDKTAQLRFKCLIPEKHSILFALFIIYINCKRIWQDVNI